MRQLMDQKKILVIPRLKKKTLSTVKLHDIEIKTYMEEKKPTMPKTHALVGLLPQRLSVMKLLYQIEYGR